MLNPDSLLGDGFAWYSIDGSFKLLRQIAHVSAQMSQDHIATAFHLRNSKVGRGRVEEEEEELEEDFSFLEEDLDSGSASSVEAAAAEAEPFWEGRGRGGGKEWGRERG